MLIEWFLSIKSLLNLLFGVLCLPGDQSHSICATDNKPSCALHHNKPSCALHLLGWFIGSCSFSSLERRPEFWVLHTVQPVGKISIRLQTNGISMLLQFSSVAQSCPTICDPLGCSMPGLPVHHQLNAS